MIFARFYRSFGEYPSFVPVTAVLVKNKDLALVDHNSAAAYSLTHE